MSSVGSAMSDMAPSAPHADAVPATHLNAAIAVTVLCFLPFGVIAIVYALRTSDAIRAGNLALAQQTSLRARRWVRIALVVGVLIWVFLLVVMLLLGAFG